MKNFAGEEKSFVDTSLTLRRDFVDKFFVMCRWARRETETFSSKNSEHLSNLCPLSLLKVYKILEMFSVPRELVAIFPLCDRHLLLEPRV